MGRKQNRAAIWNSFKQNKKLHRDKKHINHSSVLMIDPDEQKKKKLARKLAEKLRERRKGPSKAQLRKLAKLKEKKAKEQALKTVLSDLEQHQLSNKELNLLVAAKHKETKRERLKRLFLTKKAGIDIDESELFIVKSTPSQIMHLKTNNAMEQIKMHNIDSIHSEKEIDKESKDTKTEFSFGTLSTPNSLNNAIPSAMGKAYKMKDGIKIISTRQNQSKKRKKSEIVLMDITENTDKNESPSSSSSESESDQIMDIMEPPRKKKRKSFGGKVGKSTKELQAFLECASDDDVLAINSMERERKFTVKVKRLPHIIESRMALPILGEEYKIMECIKDNDVVLICGETGSGKSTQVPQFLYEAGYSFDESQTEIENNGGNGHGGMGLIGVTEPRRVAAMSVCKRVGVELNKCEHVGYQIRYDTQISDETHIKFMTDGILLREIQFDFLLNKYCVLILDEAHERNLNSDVLIGLLSRIVKRRRALFERYLMDIKNGKNMKNQRRLSPLKLIIMSATLRVEDFSQNIKLFDPSPPCIKIPSRQYPVTIHFNKSTPITDNEYEEEIFQKICKIHILLPKGHILVFLTGRRQIEFMCNRIRERFKNPTADKMPIYEQANKKEKHYEKSKKDKEKKEEDTVECAEDLIMREEDDEEGDNDNDENKNNEWMKLLSNWQYRPYAAVNVLPLYSMLEPDKQCLVFKKQPKGVRLIVIATNIAETSITIPGIKYVIDCGRVKQQKYCAQENMSKMVVEFVSKSSALQRAGRSGRTGPGHCYRLYSANFYDQFMKNHFEPEILRVPIENIILRMKAMNIRSISKFPFPTAPKQENVFEGLRVLETLGALKYNDTDLYGPNESNEATNKTLMLLRNNECLVSDEHKLEITQLGQSLIEYPITVRCAKMLILGYQGNCLPFVLAICCILSVDSLQFGVDEMDKILQKQLAAAKEDPQKKNENDKQKDINYRKEKRKMIVFARNQFANNKSDILSYLNIFGAYECNKTMFEKQSFCKQHFIRSKQISECHSLMIQLQKIIYKIYANNDFKLDFCTKLSANPPSNVQQIMLRQIICSGLIDQIARKWSNDRMPSQNNEDWIHSKRNWLVLNKAYECMSMPNTPVFIHPSSYIFAAANDALPQFLVYYSLNKSETIGEAKEQRIKRTYMRHITVIEPHWLLNIAPHLCIISEPLSHPMPYFDENEDCIKCFVEVRFGPSQWQLPRQSTEFCGKYADEKYKWFARLLLEGKIYESLKKIRSYLQHRPQIITDDKYAIASNKAVVLLVDKLKEYKIASKQRLKLSLLRNSKFLLPELKMWVYNIKHFMLKKVWPPT